MKIILLLIAVVGLGALVAILTIAMIIFFASVVAWVVITLRSVNGKEQERADRSEMKRLVKQEQT